MNSVIGITLRKILNFFDKPKNPVFSPRSLLLFSILILVSLGAIGQERRLNTSEIPARPDTIPNIIRDTANRRPAPTDSLVINKGGIETTIKYYAEDSIITKTLTNVTYLYGNAYIEYGDIKLEAAEIVIDRNINELRANGVQDTTGTWIGLPQFKDGPEEFETREIRYNFNTNKARIKGVATQQQDGFLSGEVVKRQDDGSAYIAGGRYIPCDDPQSTTYIKSTKIKVIPGDKVITGPFLLYIGGIPTPLGLPFGIFPEPKSAEKSGILFPKYGSEQNRGLFLREGGYFFVWNRNIHTALTGDIYSKGSWGLKARNQYRKRYSYSGSFEFTFNRNKNLDFEEVPLDSRDFWFSWNHRPESRGTGRFSASVNAGTSTFNNNNVSINNFQRNIRSEFRSNVSYSNSITGTPFTYSINARHNQNVTTGIVDISLPEMSMNMNRVYPLKGAKAEVLKKLNVGWNFNVTNRITNLVRPSTTSYDIANATTTQDTIDVRFNTLDRLLDNALNGARHTIPISTSFPIFKNFNMTPSVQFQELWYLEELDYTFIEDQNAVQIDTVSGFSRASTYSASLGLTTQLYGMFNTKRWKKVEAIRHIMTPTIAFSYRPDFSDERFGYYQTVQTDTTGSGTSRLLSIYDGFAFGAPGLGESAAMSFSINNKVEMKVLNDTTDAKKVPLIENLSMSGSYNFLADSFNLSNLNIQARTSLFNRKLNINAGIVLDPYTYNTDSEGTTTRQNQFAWNSGQGLGRLTSARMSLSTNLNANASSGPENPNQRLTGGQGFVEEQVGDFGSINDGGERLIRTQPEYFYDPNAYVDVDIPWNLRFSYDYSFSRGLTSTTTRQSVKIYGQVSLTPKWQITLNSGYDIDMKEITQTSLGIYRDLGCWEMRANWIPFGRFTSYNIDIQIKASSLKDLKLSRRRSFFDN